MSKSVVVPYKVKRGVSNYLLPKEGCYLARELIKEELDKKGIKCDNLREVLETMASRGILETDKPRSSEENLYTLSEAERRKLLKKKEKLVQ